MTARSAPRQNDGDGRGDRSELLTPSRIVRTCSPMSRKTVFSSRNWIVSQLIRSFSLEVASWMTGALCPRISPVVTTAITPEACSSSAGK